MEIMDLDDLKCPLKVMPLFFGHGSRIYTMPMKWVEKRDERYVTLSFITNRALFGRGLNQLLGSYYDQMSVGSGVLIAPFVPINLLVPQAKFPGDIDLLIIPYEGNQLVLSHVLAVELKVVRASFLKQGKGPNEFGFSQAQALLEHGFPRVAVGHLITSDRSPTSHWREMLVTTLIDADSGLCEAPIGFSMDTLPAGLIVRCHGRMKSRCPDSDMGLLALYVGDGGGWLPDGREATFNPNTKEELLERIAEFYHQYFAAFLLNPKYPLR